MRLSIYGVLLGGTALSMISSVVQAQSTANTGDNAIQEIVVTAQKREQVLQDVPIAITALTQETLQANRVVSVSDLNGLAPGLTVRPSPGGVGVPSFTMRGLTSYGVVPGSDKQISIYIDGVYIGSSRGSMFDLPDIARVEVLRGPQGTLFGRNATAGAVSIVTREPTGEAGIKQQLSLGNYDQFRTRTTLDLPSWGPFSAYVSFVHDERTGDIKNRGAGTKWNRSSPYTNLGVGTSPETLGDKNVENVFAAIKFEPAGAFKATYKFDYATNHFTPEGSAIIGYDPTTPLLGSLVNSLISSQPTPVTFASNGRRPPSVNNDFVVPNYQRTMGHMLALDWYASDNFSIKNIASYRKTYMFSSSEFEGAGGLVFTSAALVPYATFAVLAANPSLATSPSLPALIGATATRLAPAIGSRFCLVCNSNEQRSEQWSDELQFNFENDMISATVGLLYFHQKDQAGGIPGMQNNYSFAVIPASGLLPLGNWSTTYSKGTSLAAYGQAEVRFSEQFELVAGARITRDKKDATLVTLGDASGTYSGTRSVVSPTYKKTKPNYSIGLNYKPRDGMMFYGKFSTAFVSGGTVADIPYEPETVRSFEIGAKADFFDHHLRTNLALFHAKYEHQQAPQSGSNIGRPDLSTLILDAGERTAKGVELEVTAVPLDGVTLSGGMSYTDVKLSNVPAFLIRASGGAFEPTGIPPWTANFSAQYLTPELADGMHGSFRIDGTWHGRRQTAENPFLHPTLTGGSYDVYASTAPSAVINGRLGLRDISLGSGKAEIAAWVRNLFDNREALFGLRLQNIYQTSFLPARTYGLDLSVSF